MEEEHELHGGEIPDEGEMEGDLDPHNSTDIDMSAAADDDAVKELDEMKKRLKEMEDEGAALREMQAKVETEMGAVQDHVFDQDCTNARIYELLTKDIIRAAVQGFNGNNILVNVLTKCALNQLHIDKANSNVNHLNNTSIAPSSTKGKQKIGSSTGKESWFTQSLAIHSASINDPLWSAFCLIKDPHLIKRVMIPGYLSRGLSIEEVELLLEKSVKLAAEK